MANPGVIRAIADPPTPEWGRGRIECCLSLNLGEYYAVWVFVLSISCAQLIIVWFQLDFNSEGVGVYNPHSSLLICHFLFTFIYLPRKGDCTDNKLLWYQIELGIVVSSSSVVDSLGNEEQRSNSLHPAIKIKWMFTFNKLACKQWLM